jgi:hypothetical protein
MVAGKRILETVMCQVKRLQECLGDYPLRL